MNNSSKSFVHVKQEMSSPKSQTTILRENVEPIIISWPTNATSKPRPLGHLSDLHNKYVQPLIPVVPIKSRMNPALIDFVDITKEFSSTTFVNGAMKEEAITIHDPDSTCESPDETYLNSKYLKIEYDTNQDTTLEVPVETFVSDNNEIQTIHVGNYSNVPRDDVNSPTEQSFDASRDSSGICYVTLHAESKGAADRDHIRSLIPPPIVRFTRPRETRYTCKPKRGIMLYRKGRMVADMHTNISVQEFKAQLNDTSDIMGPMVIAPPTKYFMNNLNTKGANKLFANPGRPLSSTLAKNYTRHLTMKQIHGEQTYADLVLQPLTLTSKAGPSKPKQISRKRGYPAAEEHQQSLLRPQRLAPETEHVQGLESGKRGYPAAEEHQQQSLLRPQRLAPETESVQRLDKEMLPDDDVIIIEDFSMNLTEQESQEKAGPSKPKQISRKRGYPAAEEHQQELPLRTQRLAPETERVQCLDEEMLPDDDVILIEDFSMNLTEQESQEKGPAPQGKRPRFNRTFKHSPWPTDSAHHDSAREDMS